MISQDNIDKLSKNVIVTIDSLLDSRLPLIYSVFPDIANQVANDGSYLNRFKDNFTGLPYKVFKLLYRGRNKFLLSNATPTYIHYTLEHYFKDIDCINLSDDEQVVLYINFYPYDTLNADEMDIYINLIQKMYPYVNVEGIYLSNSELSPSYLLEKEIALYINYDMLDWIEYHFTNAGLLKTPIINLVTLVAPALIASNLNRKDINKNIFDDFVNATKGLINLVFIDALYFSAQMLGTIHEDEVKENEPN